MELYNQFFDFSYKLDLILTCQTNQPMEHVNYLIKQLEQILRISEKKHPLREHIVFRQKIKFYKTAFWLFQS